MPPVTRVPTILVNGQALPTEQLSLVELLRVEHSIRTPARAELRLLDVDYAQFDEERFKLGDELEVKLPGADDVVASVFSGVVVEVGIVHEEDRDDAPVLVVAAHDQGFQLAYTEAFLAYLDHRPSEVVKEIAGRHGLRTEVSVAADRDLVDPYLLQATSDREALDHLARATGCEWFTAAGSLHFRPRPEASGPRLTYAEELLRFSARYTGAAVPKEVTVRGWDVVNQQTVSVTAASIDDRGPVTELGSDAAFVGDQYRHARADLALPRALPDQTVRDQSEAQRIADTAATALVRSGLQAHGVAEGTADVVVGGWVDVQGVGAKLSGAYYVTHVTHEFGAAASLRTRFESRDEPLARTTRTLDEAATSSGGWSTGLVLGKVSNLNDPDRAGRVKVAFPALGEDVESDWARVVSIGAGEGHGFDNRPELNEEVVVGFERGDPRFPLVFGGLWSARVPPPVADAVDGASGVVAKRVLTSPAGHAVTISDGVNTSKGDAERYVSIVLSDGTELHIGEDGVRITTEGLPITLSSGDASLTLTDDGKVLIEASEVGVTTQGDTNLKATGKLNASGSSGVAIASSANAEVKGSMVKVEGSATTEIKGAMVKLN
ncbi:MAG: phage baseplate assembly protein V [Nitriliruptoraceae bacterium]